MLEALIIFNQGGIVLFQHRAEPSLLKSVDDPAAHVRHLLEAEVIQDALSYNTKRYKIVDGLTFCWTWSGIDDDFCVAAVYPDILFEGPRQYLQHWAQYLIQATETEFRLLYDQYSHHGKSHNKNTDQGSSKNNRDIATLMNGSAFEKTFKLVLEHSKTQRHNEPKLPEQPARVDASSSSNTSSATVKEAASTTAATTSSTKKATAGPIPTKERHWRGEAKVTDAAMNALNMNEDATDNKDNDASYQRALDEARQAYLPTKDEVKKNAKPSSSPTNDTTSWSAALTGMLQTLSGSKRLTVDDLQKPLERVKAHLQEKNVSVETADALCQAVRQKLTGKQLQSFYSVQTAVQQAFESTIAQLLLKPVDLVTNVRRKRDKPYVICMIGINGIGYVYQNATLDIALFVCLLVCCCRFLEQFMIQLSHTRAHNTHNDSIIQQNDHHGQIGLSLSTKRSQFVIGRRRYLSCGCRGTIARPRRLFRRAHLYGRLRQRPDRCRHTSLAAIADN
jgi:signal recognition particle GTPase